MKQLLFSIGGIILCSFLFSLTSYAQKKEYGVALGGTTYTGEILPTYTISANQPSISVFFKRNYGFTSALRYNLNYGKIVASDAEYAVDIFARNRNASIDISLVELSLMYEYNFLDFRNPKARTFVSPYVVGGVGAVYMFPTDNKVVDYSPIQLVLPVGAGVKYRLTRKMTLGLEVIIKATFTDYLDNISGDGQDIKNYNFGNPHNFDTYYFVGFRFGYSLWKIDCPFDAY